MTGTKLTSVVLAMAASATMASAATWNSDVNNASWGTDANWSPTAVPTSGDDVEFNTSATSTSRTVLLNGSRVINSLTATNHETSNSTFTLSPGTPTDSTLTILSGNITADAGPSTGSSEFTPLKLGSSSVNVPVIIGDGVTPVTTAQWLLETTGSSGTSRGRVRMDLSEIRAIAGTVVTIKSIQSTAAGTKEGVGNTIFLTQSNPNFLGRIVVDQGFPFNFISQADYGLGKGTIEVNDATVFQFQSQTQTEQANLIINNATGATSLVADSSAYSVIRDGSATLTGNLSGTGDILVNKTTSSTIWYNTLIHDGDSTLSGNVTIAGGYLRINGTWSGTGDVLAYQQYTGNGFRDSNTPATYGLEGSGTLGLASGKSVTIQGNNHNTVGSDAQLIPGTAGTIGSFTIGTDNTNTLHFADRSQLLIDIDGASADLLTLNGNLDLSGSTDSLVFNILNAPSSTYTLVTYTGTLSGTFDNIIGLPAGYTVDYSTAGRITLVPEPGMLSLLAVGGLALLRRRRA